MKKFIFLPFLFSAMIVCGQQNCDNLSTFDSLHAFLRENYSGYADKVNQPVRKEFDQFTIKQRQRIAHARNKGQYFLVIKNWIRFFKDEHLSISVPFDTANGKLAQAIASTEKVRIPDVSLLAAEASGMNSIEGVYYTTDSSYTVAVVKSDDGFRQYAGIVLASKIPGWSPGSVKFEMVVSDTGRYDVIWYNRNHQPIFSTLDFSQGNTFYKEGWHKKGAAKRMSSPAPYTPPFPEENAVNAFFRQIDPQTAYLRIGSFNSDYIEQIDSVISANKQLLESLPYLVIDIRGNGGGADIAYRQLKKLMYTGPVRSVGVDLVATPYNIDITKQLINSISGIPDAEKKEYNDMLETARNSGTRMFNFSPDTVETAHPLPFPKKIAIVINSRCASTAEQFLLEARQSGKVTLFGTRTRGILDYANVREKPFCSGFVLDYPTTRSRRIDIGQAIDNIGIKPDVEIDFAKAGWLDRIVQVLHQ